ncbi:Rossmann-fold NAD(P)-binding domain-containing protein [Flindersiella endophytica]
MTAHEHTNVLIVGGGPVGLSAAHFLSAQGVLPILVDKRPEPSVIPRATGIHARTMELFRSTGLEPAIRQAGMEIVGPGKQLDDVRAGRAIPLLMLGASSMAELDKGFVMESHDVPYAEFTPCMPIWCGQDRYEPLILASARDKGSDIRFGTRLVSLEEQGDGVRCTLEHASSGRTYVVDADYVVAADGVRSPLRRMLGVGHRSEGVAGHFVNIVFRAQVRLPAGIPAFTLMYVHNERAQGFVVFLEPGRWMFSVNYDPERGESHTDFDTERCVELARVAAGDPALDVEIESFTPWEARHLVADTYRHGRVFFAGDACHAHPPAGGFGVNAGIQDVHNLAWKLRGVVQGWADPGLLDTYEAERRPVGAATADQAWMLFRSRGRLAEDDRDKFRDFVIVTMGYRYASAAIAGSGRSIDVLPRELTFTGEPGSRAPHRWVTYGGRAVSTIDVFKDSFVVLTGADGARWADAADHAASKLEIPLRAYRLGATGDLRDDESWWTETCGLPADGAWLVRPDGFVAWRSDGADADPENTLIEVVDQIVATERSRA